MEATPMKPPENFNLPSIRLRRPAGFDAEAVFEYGSDPEVARYTDWPVRTSMEGLEESLERRRGESWESGEEFYWIITLAGEDRAIGGISCRVDQGSAEIGFLLNRRYWGRGFTTEAAGAVVAWLLSVPSIQRVWATCDAENRASGRVLEKIGFSLESEKPLPIVRPNVSSEPRDACVYSRIS